MRVTTPVLLTFAFAVAACSEVDQPTEPVEPAHAAVAKVEGGNLIDVATRDYSTLRYGGSFAYLSSCG